MDEESEVNDQGSEESAVAQEELETNSSGGGMNPAWQEFLDAMPSSLHSQMTPFLSKWDKNYQEGINKVHSQYADYKGFLDDGVSKDQLSQALGTVQRINEDPLGVYNLLKDWLTENKVLSGEQQGQEVVPDQSQEQFDETPEWLEHPAFKEMKQTLDTLAQLQVANSQAAEGRKAEEALDKELSDLKEQYGEFDVKYVIGSALANENDPNAIENAVKSYVEMKKSIETQALENSRKPAPTVISGGGQAPGSLTDPKSLNSSGRRQMIAQMLSAASSDN